MVTTKEIESDREEYILGYNTCKEDVNKLIDEMMKKKNNEIDVMIWGEKLKARINGKNDKNN